MRSVTGGCVTSAQMYGADADELERIAAEIRGAADDLDAEGGALTAVLNRVSWLGDIASSFVGDWLGISLPKIGLSTEFLREAAANLEQQASEQRHASITSGAGGFRVKLTAQQKKLLNDLDTDARNQVGRTPAEQAAWWNGLTDEERRLLLSERPGLVMALSGLPPDALDQARQQYRSDVAAKVIVSTDTTEIGVKVGVYKVFNVGADLSQKRTVYADGSVEVTLTGASLAGVGIPGVGGSGGSTGALTYRFESEQAADAFVAGLGGAAAVGFLSPPIGAAAIATYLALHTSDLQGVGVGSTMNTTVATGPASGSFDRSVSASVDRNLDVTATVAFAASGNVASLPDVLKLALDQMSPVGLPSQVGLVEMMGDQAAGSVAGSASLTLGADGQPKSITLTLANSTGTSSGLHGPEQFTHTSGSGEMTSIELKLDDPVLAAHANELAAAVERGDGYSVVRQIQALGDPAGLLNRSTVTRTTFDMSSTDGAVDVFFGSAAGGTSSTRTTSVSVKLPGESSATPLVY